MTMTQDELAALRQRLESRIRQLRQEISGKLADGAADSSRLDGVGDSGDQSAALSESTIDFAEARRDLGELSATEMALRRIDDGSYGACVRCGDDIPTDRLRAQPLAARCISCQTRNEREHGDHHSTI